MDAEPAEGAVFLKYEEERIVVGSRRVLKVYLLDADGGRHLAATGEDMGDAHYRYLSTKPFAKFGVCDCHNRKELTIWLEMVIAESGGRREGAHLAADENHPDGVYFTAHRYERAHFPDGRRVNRWYLVDQHGSSHLAVIGVERDTKDGHYNYSAEEPFASITPLACSNQSGVYKWLETMVTHHVGGVTQVGEAGAAAAGTTGQAGANAAPAASGGASGMSASAAGSGAATASALSSGGPGGAPRKPPIVINLSALRNARKSAAALSSLAHAIIVEGNAPVARPKQARPPKDTRPMDLTLIIDGPRRTSVPVKHSLPTVPSVPRGLGAAQQAQAKKVRRLADDLRAEEERLQNAHLTRLRRAVASEVAGDTAAKAATLGWLHGALSEDERERLEHWTGLLARVLALQQEHGYWGDKGGDQQAHNSVDDDAAAGAAVDSQVDTDPAVDAATAAADAAAGPPKEAAYDGDVMTWVARPAHHRHHLRVALECLKELGAEDLPVRALLTLKLVPLVQQCLGWPHTAIASVARRMLARWQWQLSGHMHVASCGEYMLDHAAVLEEQIAAGCVPLPQLPPHKQALLNAQMGPLRPPLPGGASSYLTPRAGGAGAVIPGSSMLLPGSAPPALMLQATIPPAQQQQQQFALLSSATAAGGAPGGIPGTVPLMLFTPPAAGMSSPGLHQQASGGSGGGSGGTLRGTGSVAPGLPGPLPLGRPPLAQGAAGSTGPALPGSADCSAAVGAASAGGADLAAYASTVQQQSQLLSLQHGGQQQLHTMMSPSAGSMAQAEPLQQAGGGAVAAAAASSGLPQ